ncbi:hypothetical protein H4582DRAFT_2085330 [Lactarius indigo]|nr:hypothetical protein H4582DRAFT_2085330 [Lactarius indigo]
MSEPEDAKPKLNLVISLLESRITVKVKANMQFKKIFEVAEKRFGKDPGTLRFVYDGERLSATDTPAERSMEDGDVIDAHLQQARTHILSPRLFSRACIAWWLLLPPLVIYIDLEHLIGPCSRVFVVVFDHFHLVL